MNMWVLGLGLGFGLVLGWGIGLGLGLDIISDVWRTPDFNSMFIWVTDISAVPHLKVSWMSASLLETDWPPCCWNVWSHLQTTHFWFHFKTTVPLLWSSQSALTVTVYPQLSFCGPVVWSEEVLVCVIPLKLGGCRAVSECVIRIQVWGLFSLLVPGGHWGFC